MAGQEVLLVGDSHMCYDMYYQLMGFPPKENDLDDEAIDILNRGMHTFPYRAPSGIIYRVIVSPQLYKLEQDFIRNFYRPDKICFFDTEGELEDGEIASADHERVSRLLFPKANFHKLMNPSLADVANILA